MSEVVPSPISCIMPTADRRRFVPQAIAAFLGQGRDDAELVILDDGDDPVGDLIPADPRIRYHRETPRRVLGEKRNRLCELARGEIIVHWDDDDWHGRDRIARQVAALDSSGAVICGLAHVPFLSDDMSEAWDYVHSGRTPWVYGATFAYRRAFWSRRRFAALRVGEDTRFLLGVPASRIVAMPDNDFMVVRVHAGNTSPKRTEAGLWRRRDPAPLRARVLSGADQGREAAGAASVANVNACLVHEKPECVVDLVRNLRHLDPGSPILLYDGSADGRLLDRRLPWPRWGVEIVPNARAMKWGRLHAFALDCIDHLAGRDHDVMTIVDSDQLMLRRGYAQHLAASLGANARGVLLSSDPARQGPRTRVPPAQTAQCELALWRPWLSQFPDGEEKFVHWTFWPATVIGAEAGRAVAALFGDEKLQAILAQSKIWATEEIFFATFAALLGFGVRANPCRGDWVRYKTPWKVADLDRALQTPDAFWMHPVPRALDNPLRARVRDRHGGYSSHPPAPTPPPQAGAVWPLIEQMRMIEGWLGDDEGEALLLAARAALARPGAAGQIVEVGSHCGKATYLLGTAARTAPIAANVAAVDRFDGRVGARDSGVAAGSSCRIRFDQMVARHGLEPWIDARTGTAGEVAWDRPIDLLVIDGLHDFASVAGDMAAFEAWLTPDARVAFHDYADYFPGVQAYVDELLAQGAWEVEVAAGTLRMLKRSLPAQSAAAQALTAAA
jgi:hypothetical protein